MDLKTMLHNRRIELERERVIKGEREKKGFKDILSLFGNLGKIFESVKKGDLK